MFDVLEWIVKRDELFYIQSFKRFEDCNNVIDVGIQQYMKQTIFK